MLPLAKIGVIAGQLLGPAFACGLNLYATVAVLGLSSRLGWMGGLPPGLRGLENMIVIGSAAALYLIEFVVDKIPHFDTVWDALHTLIRPGAAALLALMALSTAPVMYQVTGTLLAGLAALAAHGTKAGLRLTMNTAPHTWKNVFVSLLEDVLAVAIAVVALVDPDAALGVLVGFLLLALVLGPRLWRATVLGVRGLHARVYGFFRGAGWKERNGVPRMLRGLLDTDPLGIQPIRAARVAVQGVRGVGAFRNGWLVIRRSDVVFLYRSLLGPRRALLPTVMRGRVVPGPWADRIDLESAPGGTFTLFLLKDGPPAEQALRELVEDRVQPTGASRNRL